MKKTFILLPCIALLACLALSSYVGGSSTNMTGSHGDKSGCSGSDCHGKRNTNVGVAIEIQDSLGHAVYAYRPGKRYMLKMTAFNLTTDMLPKYGFQMVTADRFGIQTGKFDPATRPAGTMLDSSGSSVIFEQQVKLSPASGGGGGYGTAYETSIAWIAPARGTDTVKVFGINCLVNSDNDTTGDRWNSTIFSIPEENFLAVADVKNTIAVTAWPNPVSDKLHLSTGSVAEGDYSVSVCTMNGVNVASQVIAGSDLNTAVINTSAWAAGMYQVVVKGAGIERTIPVVKQ